MAGLELETFCVELWEVYLAFWCKSQVFVPISRLVDAPYSDPYRRQVFGSVAVRRLAVMFRVVPAIFRSGRRVFYQEDVVAEWGAVVDVYPSPEGGWRLVHLFEFDCSLSGLWVEASGF